MSSGFNKQLNTTVGNEVDKSMRVVQYNIKNVAKKINPLDPKTPRRAEEL